MKSKVGIFSRKGLTLNEGLNPKNSKSLFLGSGPQEVVDGFVPNGGGTCDT